MELRFEHEFDTLCPECVYQFYSDISIFSENIALWFILHNYYPPPKKKIGVIESWKGPT